MMSDPTWAQGPGKALATFWANISENLVRPFFFVLLCFVCFFCFFLFCFCLCFCLFFFFKIVRSGPFPVGNPLKNGRCAPGRSFPAPAQCTIGFWPPSGRAACGALGGPRDWGPIGGGGKGLKALKVSQAKGNPFNTATAQEPRESPPLKGT